MEPGPAVPYYALSIWSAQSGSLDGTQLALSSTYGQQHHHQGQQYPRTAHLLELGHPQNDFGAATTPSLHSMGASGPEYQGHNSYALQHDPHRSYDLAQYSDVHSEAVGDMPGPAPRQDPQPEDDSKVNSWFDARWREATGSSE